MQMPRPRLSLLIATIAFFAASPARAELRFPQTSAHLKATAEEQTLTTQFSFQNTGPDAVFVASLTTSCPCTLAEIDKKHFAPGETAFVTVTYKIGTREGPQSQTITLLTNEKNGTAYTLTLKVDIPKRTIATLPRVVPVTPTLLFWSKKPFATKTVRVDLRGIEGAKISASCSNDGFKFSLKQTDGAPEALFAITPDETATDARGELNIVIEHGAEKISVPSIPLTVQAK